MLSALNKGWRPLESCASRDEDIIYPFMDAGIRERVDALRREIAEIQKLNLAYLQKPTQAFNAMNEHARRSQRLTEIMDELRSMTEWKRT